MGIPREAGEEVGDNLGEGAGLGIEEGEEGFRFLDSEHGEKKMEAIKKSGEERRRGERGFFLLFHHA